VSASTVNGVLIAADDAAFLSAALRKLIELSDRGGGRAVARVYELERELARSATRSAIGTAERARTPAPEISRVQLIDTSTAAAQLGCSERNVRAMAARGSLNAQRVGGRWLVDAAEVEARSQRTKE